MKFFEIIGFIAAACTTFSFLPQAVKTIRTKDTKSLSLSMYGMFTTGVLLWLIYGIYLNDIPLIAANSIGFLLSGTVLFLKIKHG